MLQCIFEFQYDILPQQVCDQNRDGYLDQDEYTAFTHPESFDHTKEVHLEQSFQDMDKNNDGSITVEEYIGITILSQ